MAYTVSVDKDKCSGCTICVRICPTGTLKMDKESRKAYNTGEMCDNAWGCIFACPKQALNVVEAR